MARLSKRQIAELNIINPNGVFENVDLALNSQWQIGGIANLMLCPRSTVALRKTINWFIERGISYVVIGHTTNLLFSDKGLNVPCIVINASLSNLIVNDNYVVAEAGIWVPKLARLLMLNNLTGAEHICGIPGSLGGLVCMNGGSQRKSISQSIVSVESIDITGNYIKRSRKECNFEYRQSIFQNNRDIITSVQLKLNYGIKDEIRRNILSILKDRRKKFPKEPNCGSIFKSNPIMYDEIGPPGRIIERLGLKGMQVGGAQVSEKHANFFVNIGNATSTNMLQLISQVNSLVLENTGWRLDAEVLYLCESGKLMSADEACARLGVV
jgi:UDP-N-acetylmuramate dehydrogenase